MNLSTTRTALHDAIQEHISPKLRGYPFMTRKPQVPCYVIEPQMVKYHDTFDDSSHATLIVQILANPVDLEAAQRALDTWLDPEGTGSLVAAIESASWAEVDRMDGGYQIVTLRDGGTELLTSKVYVKILDGP